MKKAGINGLIHVRGYGALAVLMCHLIQWLISKSMISANSVTDSLLNGARAVQMFYIISGFTVFLSLARAQEWVGGGTARI